MKAKRKGGKEGCEEEDMLEYMGRRIEELHLGMKKLSIDEGLQEQQIEEENGEIMIQKATFARIEEERRK